MAEFELKRDYRIEHIDDSESVQRADATAMWVREGVLGHEEAERRSREVCMVGTDGGGNLCGVTTAYIVHNRQLRLDVWNIRGFVADQHRAGNLATNLLLRTRIHLNDVFRSGEDTRAIAAVIEVENPTLQRLFPEALWQPTMFTYFGNNHRGDHCRVHWFTGAELPEPPADAGR